MCRAQTPAFPIVAPPPPVPNVVSQDTLMEWFTEIPMSGVFWVLLSQFIQWTDQVLPTEAEGLQSCVFGWMEDRHGIRIMPILAGPADDGRMLMVRMMFVAPPSIDGKTEWMERTDQATRSMVQVLLGLMQASVATIGPE